MVGRLRSSIVLASLRCDGVTVERFWMLGVRVYPDLYSPHMTQVYSGLYHLSKEGRIDLEITSRFDYRIRKSQG